jgi:small conductance mechanosensitive channel
LLKPIRSTSRFIGLLLLLVLAVPPAMAAEAPASEATADPAAQPAASPAALADVLEDEQARKRLIEDLRRMAAESSATKTEEVAATDGPSLPERVAEGSRAAVERVLRELRDATETLSAIGSGPAVDWDALGAAAIDIGLLILVTMAVFLGLRRLARPAWYRIGAWTTAGSAGTVLLRRAGAVVVAAGIDVLNIVVAWLAGWALAAFVLSTADGIDPRLSLFLNAFVAIEGLKALMRVVFAARNDALRLLPINAEDAAYWNAWLAHLATFVGYGALLVVPLVNREVTPAFGQVVYVIVIALGFVYALSILLQNRARVRARLERIAHEGTLASVRLAAAVFARLWHIIAIAYLLTLTGVLLSRSESALPFMALATLQSLATIGLGVLLAAIIGRAISRGIRVPEATAAKFPTLEMRLNAFVPRGLKGIRLVIVVLVIALLLDAWNVFDLVAWLGTDAGIAVVSSAATVVVILALATAAWIAMASWIDHWLSVDASGVEPNSRQRTLLALFRNAAAVVIITMAVMITLSELGINIGPLIAGAGVLGLAIGFGSQKLVQDIIGGVFIQLENAINEGDWVTAGGISGTAERLSIRSVGLRDLEGTMHIVPFSSVDTVSNYMRDFALHVGRYSVAYREDTDEVIKHLLAAFEELKQDPDMAQYITGDLQVDGVAALADSSVNMRIRIRTVAGYQWYVGRGYNRLVKQHFDAAGIEIPFPHQTLYFGQDKDGSAPPANIRRIDRDAGDTDADD